jgi:DNA-binding MarR family transcriptional regulator
MGVTPIIGSVPPRRAASSVDAAPAPGVAPRAAGSDASPVEPAATRVLRRFRMVFNAVKTHFQQVEKTAGVGGAQLWALSVVHDEPGIGVGALARAMDVHQTTASNLVRALVEQGLVDSQRSGSDRRASQLRVTHAGARLLARAPGPFAGVLPQALARLDPQTLERLDADLVALLQLLEADRRAARIPLAEM